MKMDQSESASVPCQISSSSIFQELAEHALIGMLVVLDGRFVYANPKCCELFGYPSEEFLRLTPFELAIEEDRGLFEERIHERLYGGAATVESSVRGLRKDGSIIELEVRGTRIEVGGKLALATSFVEVSEVRRAIDDRDQQQKIAQYVRRERDTAQGYLDVAGVMILIFAADETITLINRKGCAVLGYSDPSEVLGRSWIDVFIPKRMRHEMRTAFHLFLSDGSEAVENFQNPILTRTGEERIINWHNKRLFDESGRPTGILSSGEDVTERNQMEESLRASEARFRQIAENLQEVFWITDGKKTKLEYLSPAYETIWGRSVEEVYQRPSSFLDAIVPDDRNATEARVRKQAESDYDVEYRIARPDGNIRWVRDRSVPIKDAEGQVHRIIGIAEDITDRKIAEENLRRSEERFRNIVSTSPDGCICLDGAGTITVWNRAAERIFGYAAAEVLGKSAASLVPDRFNPTLRFDRLGRGAASAFQRAGRPIELVGLRRDGIEFPIEVSFSSWKEAGRRQFGVFLRDISERQQQQKRLYQLAHYDHLTQLANRTLLQERLQKALAGGKPAAVILVDLDGFKEVNDSAGHHAGDQVLVQVGERLHSVLPDGATLARLGGDEFAICVEMGECPIITPLVQRVQSRIAEPFSVGGGTTFLGASIGVALAPAHGADAEELMINADLAMYEAKKDRSTTARFFVPRLREAIDERLKLETDLRRGFKAEEFHLYYQPQVRCRDRAVTGAEALLRWQHPERGVLLPGAFLSGLRDRPLGTAIGNWAIRTACRDAAALRAMGQPIRVGVNLFAGQFIGGGLVETVVQALAASDLPPDFLELEITEEIILRDNDVILKTMRQLREIGVRLAFDDYGTGYASLSMLKRFPLTRLKIDRSFIPGLSSDAGDAAIVDAVIRLGQSFALEVIAEGIETEEQERLFLGFGGEEAQGFLYGRAVPRGEFGARAVVNRLAS